jgi:hypothetical protein
MSAAIHAQLPSTRLAPMPPLALTDGQMDQILLAARPLAIRDRDLFLKEVVAALTNGGGPVGDGDVNRVCRAAQKRFFDPPDLSHGDASKYR